MNLADRELWYQYSRSIAAAEQMGIAPVTWQVFKFKSSTGDTLSRSMLTLHEMALLYALARHVYKGRGAIVDAGPLLGASTFALCRGLADNTMITPAQRVGQVYSFDLFRSQGYEKFLGDITPPATGSLLPEFLKVNADHITSIVPHQGDFMSWAWPNMPVEIFFLDLAKSWELNTFAIRHYFPVLIPGESILVQQDYIHFNEYWIHITMEHFAEHFEVLGFMHGATCFYRCVKAIDRQAAMVDLKVLPYDAKRILLERARAKAPFGVQQVMKSAAAKCAIEHGKLQDARDLLNDVVLDAPVEHPTLDVRGIARSNYGVVTKMLETALAKQTVGLAAPH
ncbi:hypothetical protein [Acidisphaera sp. L21]|uniref:hypothetical protein n=1 Tax=Acidisphaera sp. L21 TaxID=1641851 RepID=UPI00131BDC84|nr:hypothetical protein [Acidisphaera sp. L21]